MGVVLNDEKVKERIKESKKNDKKKKVSTTKENTEKKNNKETKEEDKKNQVKKVVDDGTYKYRPFEAFFKKKQEEAEAKKE